MECRSCSEALTALIDEELSSAELGEVKQHLEGCADCLEEYESLSYANQLVAQLEDLDLAPDLWTRIEVHLSGTSTREVENFWARIVSLLTHRPWVPAGALGAVVVAFLGFLLFLPPADPLENEFSTFMQEREAISNQNRAVLFGERRLERFEPRRNPFVQTVSQSEVNPFEE